MLTPILASLLQLPNYRTMLAVLGVRFAVIFSSIVVFFVSFLHFDIWARMVEFLRRTLYNRLTSYKRHQLLTNILISEHSDLILENHQVTTQDGCTLLMHRFRSINYETFRGVILMQHGLMETSSVFVLHGSKSLPMRLARQGYDVWLGNNRSSLYGQMAPDEGDDEIRMNSKIDDTSFWKFSIEELIKYDFPAMVEKVKSVSRVDKIDFVGQSQGAGQAICALCEMPQLKDSFNSMVLLSPACFLRQNPDELLIQLLLNAPSKWFGEREFMVLVCLFQMMLPQWLVGNSGYAVMRLMGFLKRPLGGSESWKIRARWFSGIPFGCTSVNNLLHWLQVLRNGGCLTKFGTQEPYQIPEMLRQWSPDAHRPNMLVLLGDKDCVVDEQATRKVFEECYRCSNDDEGTDVTTTRCKVYIAEDFGHTDFLWSDMHNNEHIYDKIEKFLLVKE